MKIIIFIVLSVLLVLIAYFSFEKYSEVNENKSGAKTVKPNRQFYMTDSDRAIYNDLLENNPADIIMIDGENILNDLGGELVLAKFLGIRESELPKFIAGFPRYVKEIKMVVGLDQLMQGVMHKQNKKILSLQSKEMFALSTYVKSLANGEKQNINVKENDHMYKAYTLGKHVFNQKRGKRGMSCRSCHSKDIIGSVLRTQPLPNLGKDGVASSATWPAYRMTRSSLRTLQRRFQGCMKNVLQTVIPIGSDEMLGLEIYLTRKSNGVEIMVPGIKR